MPFTVVIPARQASSRLPNKPLLEINGHPMVYWTWMQAKASGAHRVIIATESQEVANVCHEFGAEVCMTKDTHQSGTERIAEVIELSLIDNNEIVVNVQGDEPLLPPELIHQVAEGLQQYPHIPMATLAEPIESVDQLHNPNVVKVVRDRSRVAMYFSRASVPWARDEFASAYTELPNYPYRRHIGLYAYRAGFVRQYVKWPESPIEQIEKLEQLRVLHNGQKILVLDALMDAGVGVDTEEDLNRVRQIMAH